MTCNLALDDVSTIANYDSSIIPILAVPIGSAYRHDPEDQEFRREPMPDHLSGHCATTSSLGRHPSGLH
jgi:hypothetical protein